MSGRTIKGPKPDATNENIPVINGLATISFSRNANPKTTNPKENTDFVFL